MLEVIPITLREANDFVAQFHRHNGRTSRNGGKFAVGLTTGTELIGVAIVGLPIARLLNDGRTAEVTRVCVLDHAQKGACSKLYSACWKAWRAMGGKRIVTYTLQSESGSSLKGAGFKIVAQCKPGSWNRIGRERDWQPIYGQKKIRWSKE